MPQDPRTWNPYDYVSASYLNYDLYAAGSGYPVAEQFVPNGVRWHSQRALYKVILIGTGQTLPSGGTWKQVLSSTAGVEVIIDNSGLYGAHMDPAKIGTIEDVILSSGGGLPGVYSGGWYLMSGFIPTGSTSGTTNVACGISQGTTNPAFWGTQQKSVPSSGTITPFIIDLVDSQSSTYTLAASNAATSASAIPTTADGSGSTCSFSALWVSGNTGVTTVLPSPLSGYNATTSLTAAQLNGATGLQVPLRNLNYPPMFRAVDATGVSVASSTTTNIGLSSTTVDTYSGYSKPTYTVQQAGLYLVHFQVCFGNFSGQCAAGVTVNGTTYWGPAMPTPSNDDVTATKTQIFSLDSGDTITPVGWQNSGSTLTTPTNVPSRMIVVKLSGTGSPSTLPNVPDVTYRYTAGTQPDLSPVFNAHLANDLTFLTFKPYLMSYQTSATTGIAMTTPTKVIMQADTGIIHGDSGDNYSGYNTSTGVYTCQRTGWYLVCGEIFMAYPSLTTSPLYCFQVFPSPSGVNSSDGYQAAAATNSTNPGGATCLGFYHLRAGDTIYPGIYTVYSSSTTTSTAVNSGRNSHFEMVWVSE
jgi:hypothetical protein